MTVAEALREKLAGKTKADLARELDMNWPTLHRILTGQKAIGIESYKKIVAVFPDLADVLLGQDEVGA